MNTILIISKDDIGKTNFSPSHFDLKKMCEDVMEVALFEQKNKRSIKTKFKGTDFTVFADKALMEYSLFNLINNAFKYSEEQNGEVLLNLTSTKKSIRIAITDFGIGIPIEDHGKIGNTFFRASNTHGIQGTGLGLYIVKTFTQRNAGQFKIKSTLGKGTTALLLFSKTTHH
jgi:signal transduction histidine kinase